MWLGLVSPAGASAIPPGRRLVAERDAADRAEAMAVRAVGRPRPACVVSRSHTGGIAAALAGPAPGRLGVDLVRLDRVGDRHAKAVASARERRLLNRQGTLAAPLAWALKEAAAKATGDPWRWFPGGLRIAAASEGGLAVRWRGYTFDAGWRRWRGTLCAWVWELEPGPRPAVDGPFDPGDQGVHGPGHAPPHLVADGPPPAGARLPAPG
jgi:hypothetical protein